MSTTQKELQLKLTVTADASGGVRALQQLAHQAQATQAAMGMQPGAQPGAQAAAGPVGPGGRFMPYPTYPGYGYGGGGYGGHPAYPGAYGPYPPPTPAGHTPAATHAPSPGGGAAAAGGTGLLKKAIIAGTLFKGAEMAAAVARVKDDTFLTNDQGARQLFRDVVPFGGHLQGLHDSATGRAAAFERAEFASAQRSAEMHGRTQLAAQNLSLSPELAGQVARLGALNKASPVLEGFSDRSTAAGEKSFRDRMRLLPLERESARAQREAAVAGVQQAESTEQRLDLERKMAALQSKRGGLEKQLGGIDTFAKPSNVFRRVANGIFGQGVQFAPTGADRQDILNRLGENEREIQATGGLQKEARMAEHRATIEAAQKRREAGEVGAKKLQVQAEILEDDAARAAGGAQRIAGMNRFQRRNALRDLQLLQAHGRERVTDEQLANAQGLAPQTVAKILETQGKSGPEFDMLRKIAPADFAGDVDELRKKAGQKRDEATTAQLDLDRNLARSVAAAGADLGKYLRDIIEQLVESIKREILIDKFKGKNAP